MNAANVATSIASPPCETPGTPATGLLPSIMAPLHRAGHERPAKEVRGRRGRPGAAQPAHRANARLCGYRPLMHFVVIAAVVGALVWISVAAVRREASPSARRRKWEAGDAG